LSKLILIVDDDEKNLKLVRHLLQISGYATIETQDGGKAITMAREKMPDLILMDIQMPGMNGIDAAKLLKADPRTRDIRLVAFTAYAMAENRDMILGAGYIEYFTKPIDIKSFLKRISRYLEDNYATSEPRKY
jgi:two-component system, cell cycle response regulator DivK